MTKKILFLLTFLLTTLGGGNFALAEEVYSVTSDGSNVNTSTDPSAFVTGTTFQATSSVAMYIGSGWGITSADITGNASPKYDSTDWDYNNATNLPNAGAYLIFTPSADGTFIFNGTKNGKNGNKYLTITTAVDEYVRDAIVKFNGGSPIEYNSDRVGYSLPDTKKGNYSNDSKTPFTAEFSVIANKTYYVFVQTFSSWSFTGFTFRSQENYTTEIPIHTLRYRPGISASNGMDRSVGGFNLTFTEAHDGIKCNDTNKLIFRSKYQSGSSTWNQGKMTIALDANNSNKTISKIELIYADNSLSANKITVSSGTLTDDTDNKKLVWTGSGVNSVTFTANYTDNTGQTPAANITKINITTSAQPTFTKVTPTLVFPDTESITTSDSKTINLEMSSTVTPDNFLFDVSFDDGGTNVTYTNENSSLGTIAATSGVTSAGVASVIASFSGNDFFNSVGSSFSLIVNGDNPEPFTFTPDEIYLNVGKEITPYINYDQNDFDTDNLTFTAYPSDIVNTSIVSHQKEANRKLCKIVADGTSVAAGKTVVIAAKCKRANSSDYCYSTLKVHIKAAGSRNFEWMGPADYYINKGDYMFIPGIIGNSSGNNSYSKASKNAEKQSYVYSINRKTETITWWDKKGEEEKYYKIDEGCPDYRIVENTSNVENDVAYIFWNTGQGSSGKDTLMIYGNKAGDATLRAFDPQDPNIYTNVTIHVTDPDATDGVNTLNTTYVNNMTFPYTWDFTKNFSDSQLEDANPLYWEKKGNSYSMGIASSFNYDYADENGDGSTQNTDNNDKLFSDGSALIPQLYGLKISLGNSSQGSWFSKRDRLRLNPIAGEGKPHLQIIGGHHILSLPAPPSDNRPGETYKLLLKVKANGNQARIEFNGGDASSMDVLYLVNGKDKDGNSVSAGDTKTFEAKVYEQPSGSNSDWLKDVIFSYTVQPNEDISLKLDNVDVYWIAYSTEEKTLAKFDNTTYWASTYSYTKDLDLSKSKEVHPKVIAHYASEFSGQNKVKMTEVPNNAVPSETGLFLKAETNPGNSYFIANAENVSVYSAPSPISGTNYLKANPEVDTKINANTTIDDNQYTNFTLAYRYKVVHAGGGIDSYYTPADDWSFYRIAPSGITVTNKNLAYLQVPGDLYIDAYSSRRAGDATGANPASQELLKIVFDDDNNTGTTDLDISTVTPQTVDNGAWYTLQGVRVSAPLKGGIYIHNGKKIVVK